MGSLTCLFSSKHEEELEDRYNIIENLFIILVLTDLILHTN